MYKPFPAFIVLCCALGSIDVPWKIVKGSKRFRVADAEGTQLLLSYLYTMGRRGDFWTHETCVRRVKTIQTWVRTGE